MGRNNTIECNEIPVVETKSLAMELRAAKTRLIRDHQRKIKELDRHIQLLESTDAENIIAEASRILFEQ